MPIYLRRRTRYSEAKTAKSEIVLDATVDLGIGYAQFVLGTGQESARFDISSGGDGSHQFNHASTM